jgi:hypothetical protein
MRILARRNPMARFGESLDSLEESFSVLGDALSGFVGHFSVPRPDFPRRAVQDHYRAISRHQRTSLEHFLAVSDQACREHQNHVGKSEEQLRLPV